MPTSTGSRLLGELIGMVERWKAAGMPMARTHSRFNKRGWGNIVGGILEACGEPDFLANAEEAAGQLDETRREFAELSPSWSTIRRATGPPSELVELCASTSCWRRTWAMARRVRMATRMGTLAGRFVDEAFRARRRPYGDLPQDGRPQREGVSGQRFEAPNRRTLPNLAEP